MRKTTIASAFTAAILLAAAPARAQLPAGTWTGTMTPPNQGSMDVTYKVDVKHDSLSIAIVVPGQGSLPFQDAALDGETLTFWWTPGARVECRLQRQADGSYEGTCQDGGGSTGKLVMKPPHEHSGR